MSHSRCTLWIVVVVVVAGAVAGCDGRYERLPSRPTFRVVSYAPAITQMIVDLGAADSLVGVAEHDAAAPEGVPTVGSYYKVDTESLLATKPTHVFLMAGKEGVPKILQSLSISEGFKLVAYPNPSNVIEMVRIFCDDRELDGKRDPSDPPSVSFVLERWHEGNDFSLGQFYGMLSQINTLVDNTETRRPEVLMVIGLEPLTASGVDTVHNDVLTLMLGGRNAARYVKNPAPVFDRELLLDWKPEVILLLQPNEPPLGSIDKDPRLAVFRGLDIPAVRDGRIVLINDPLVMLPSTSLTRIGVEMAKAIHPQLADRIDKVRDSEELILSEDTMEQVEVDPAKVGGSDADPVAP
ncbi:MAG: hypothetical protein CMJ18_09450 [Phycisphaeraceae bacterium]|nr:hypothetical protein [Phycisphaeraceae bacterium]